MPDRRKKDEDYGGTHSRTQIVPNPSEFHIRRSPDLPLATPLQLFNHGQFLLQSVLVDCGRQDSGDDSGCRVIDGLIRVLIHTSTKRKPARSSSCFKKELAGKAVANGITVGRIDAQAKGQKLKYSFAFQPKGNLPRVVHVSRKNWLEKLLQRA
ncbi:hypothetical protein Ancab_021526 [Ancistrocladus abbreviatus]